MSLSRLVELVRCQDSQLNLLDWLVLQLTLETHVDNVEVDVVVLQLMHNIKWSIVACIERICIKCT